MTPRPRVLVATPLPPSVTGGIEEYAYSVSAELSALGDSVTVLTSSYGSGRGSASDPPDVVFLGAKEVLGRPFCFRPASYLTILRCVRHSDIVHVHMPFPFVEVAVAGLARALGKPLVVTYHMDATVDRGSGSGPKLLHYLAEKAYRYASAVPTVLLADRVCTNTRAYALQSPVLRSRLGRLQVVHQGIDPAKLAAFSPERALQLRRELLGDRYTELVSCVGRLVPYKGLTVLLQSVRDLRREGTLFVIGGRGPQEAKLRQYIADHRLSNVRLIGYVPDDDLVNLLQASDLAVAPSVSLLESTPITLLYAKAVGTPVLGTDIGGTGECIPNDGTSGLVVPFGDPGALGVAIVRLLEARGPRSREAAPRTWGEVASDYRHLMGQLQQRRRGGPTSYPGPGPVPYAGLEGAMGGK